MPQEERRAGGDRPC